MIEDSLHHLHMTLMLHMATHDAEGKSGGTRLGNEPGNDGMKGTFSRRDAVRVIRIQRETKTSILHRDARIGYDNA